MTDDTRNFIEQQISRAEDITGETPSPENLSREFAKLDFEGRLGVLDKLHRDMKAKSDEPLTLLEAQRELENFQPYVKALRRTHDVLRKVGR